MSFRMPDDLVPVVASIAEEEGRAVSDVIARLIRAGLRGATVPTKTRKTSERLDAVSSGAGKISLPVSVETPAEAAQVPRVVRETKATRDNLPGPRPAPEPSEAVPGPWPSERAANACIHGNDPKFCHPCKVYAMKYGKARNG